MAALIDDDMLFSRSKGEDTFEQIEPKTLVQEFFKCMDTNGEIALTKKLQDTIETFRLLTVERSEYLLDISFGNSCRNLSVFARQINKKGYKKITSKQREILTIKDLIKSQYEKEHESLYYLHEGCIFMAIKMLFDGTSINIKPWIRFYAQIVTKNLNDFHRYLRKSAELSIGGVEKLSELQEELLVSQIIRTTAAYFDVSEEKTQFKLAEKIHHMQKEEIMEVHLKIEAESELERTNHNLLQLVKTQATSKWIAAHLIDFSAMLLKKGKKLLNANRQGEKIEDFLFNIIKVEIKDRVPHPIGSGGSSYIYLVRALLTYINSVDFTSYMKKEQKSERLLVMKSLKPELEDKLQDKLIHEKSIVSKLKGSCSMFIPKYYGTEKDAELSKVLLMQHITGQELDSYLKYRILTASLWTKIYLLIGIIHGIRHLIRYEIVHLDIKPINIIVCRNLMTKLLDYGEAYHKDVCPKNYCPGYTFPYVAPETYIRYEDQRLHRSQQFLQFSEKQDVFAFGMIMYQMFLGVPALTLSKQREKSIFYSRQIHERIFFNHEMLSSYGEDHIMSTIMHLTLSCLSPDPQDRPKFDWIGVSLKLILNSYISH